MVKNIFVVILILFFSAEIKAQEWPESADSRSEFSGFGKSASADPLANEGVDYTDTMSADDGGFGEGGLPDNPGVPIVESIIGLLGLGGAYAWRLIAKKRKED